jgi:hypothetical protein
MQTAQPLQRATLTCIRIGRSLESWASLTVAGSRLLNPKLRMTLAKLTAESVLLSEIKACPSSLRK